jgi:REP element-mobilizing transposase RayT
MGHTYTNLLTHIIFSTKNRLPYLREERRDDVFAYIGGIVRELKGTAINVNGAADHVHALVRLPAALALVRKRWKSLRLTHHAGFMNDVYCIGGLPGRADMRPSA